VKQSIYILLFKVCGSSDICHETGAAGAIIFMQMKGYTDRLKAEFSVISDLTGDHYGLS
jgi:hypothetical protein